MSVLKNLIISTKLSTLMSVELISTCHPRNSDKRSKRTFVDRMDIVRHILVIVSDDVAREFPVISRICGPRPIYVNLTLTADLTTASTSAPTSISCHDTRTDEYVILTLQTPVRVIRRLDRSAQQLPRSRVFTGWRDRSWLHSSAPSVCQSKCAC